MTRICIRCGNRWNVSAIGNHKPLYICPCCTGEQKYAAFPEKEKAASAATLTA